MHKDNGKIILIDSPSCQNLFITLKVDSQRQKRFLGTKSVVIVSSPSDSHEYPASLDILHLVVYPVLVIYVCLLWNVITEVHKEIEDPDMKIHRETSIE